MRPLNGFFGNGPGSGDDTQSQRDLEAYNRNRLQMTVATSTFAGVALVGMFCSCLWFVCCRNSSSKTRKKRTWAAANAEAGLHNNPYSYDGYLDAQGYMQMNDNGEGCPDAGGVAPYISNPLYHPSSLYPSDNGIASAYDFNDHFGFTHADKGHMVSLASDGTLMKDVPPSYTALFFAATDPSSGIGGAKGARSGNDDIPVKVNSDPRVTSIQPIHLKVTSHVHDQLNFGKGTLEVEAMQKKANRKPDDSDDDSFLADFIKKEDPTTAPPVSLLSVESDPEKDPADVEGNDKDKKSEEPVPPNKEMPEPNGAENKTENPPPYNPGFRGYNRF